MWEQVSYLSKQLNLISALQIYTECQSECALTNKDNSCLKHIIGSERMKKANHLLEVTENGTGKICLYETKLFVHYRLNEDLANW